MEDTSVLKKISVLVNVIASSPLFLFCCMIGVFVFIFYIISVKKKENTNKIVFIVIWLSLALLLIINYSTTLMGIVDNLFDDIFTALFFPNLTVYILILSIVNIALFYSIFSKNLHKINRILNFASGMIINILCLFIVDTVNKNNINVYEELTVYSNSTLLILLELTTSVFVSWILLGLLFKAHNKLKKFDKSKYPEMEEIVFN